MFKRITILIMLAIAGCSNPAPKVPEAKPVTPVKPATPVVKTPPNPWVIGSYAMKEGETEARKFVRIITDGSFSDSNNSNNYLYVEVMVNKANAGIFLHELNKSNPAVLFTEPVEIKMTNPAGQELLMTSTRRWNSSGGIMIERNNNDYSQFRIFMLQSKGMIDVEIKNPGVKTYRFRMSADGFSESFSKL